MLETTLKGMHTTDKDKKTHYPEVLTCCRWKQATQFQYNVKFANSAVLQVAQRVLDQQTLGSLRLDSPEQGSPAGATSQKNAWLSMPLTDPKIKFEVFTVPSIF